MDAKAYLAACIMIGAALEADLGDVQLLRRQLPGHVIPKQKNGKPKPLIDWTFYQRLRAAREAGWLPTGLALDDKWSHRKARIGDYAEVVREVTCQLLRHGFPKATRHEQAHANLLRNIRDRKRPPPIKSPR
jgi:hypothetical protein